MCVVRLLAEISTVDAGFCKTHTTVAHSIWHFRSEKGYATFHCYEYYLDSLLRSRFKRGGGTVKHVQAGVRARKDGESSFHHCGGPLQMV